MSNYDRAKREVANVLMETYPVGTWWEVITRQGQAVPSVMKVACYPEHKVGSVRFSMKKRHKFAKEWERTRKDLYPSQILRQTTKPEDEP